MTMLSCPTCQKPINGARKLKEHMTEEHGGYISSDIPSDTSGQAKEILGTSSLSELATKAPTTDSGESIETISTGSNTVSDTVKKQGRPKKGQLTAEEIKEKEKRAKALEAIGGVICKKTAVVPYKLWAKLVGDKSLELRKEQAQELADAYLTICRGYDANFTHPLMGILAAMAINAELVAERIGIPLGDEEDNQETQTTQQM